MGSTISKDDVACSTIEREGKITVSVKNEEEWKRKLVHKIEQAEKFLNKQGGSYFSSSSPSREDYLLEANKLGDVTEMTKLLKEGVNGNKLTWKLLLTALPGSGKFKSIANIFIKGQYGVVHAAVQIGRYLIDWNDSSMVRPRLLKGKKHYAALDLTLAGNEIPNCDDSFFVKIAMLIVDWNRSDQPYNVRTRNCQHFVDDLLKNGLGISPKWSPAIASYLDGVREDCDNGLPHYVDENGKRVFFQSHKQLDREHENLPKDQMALLKAFDRGYMVRWMTSGYTDQDAEPLYANDAHKCHVFGALTTM